jgi:hypothetical protein
MQNITLTPIDDWYDPERSVYSYTYIETPPSFVEDDSSSENKDAATILTDILGDKMEGKAIVETGEEEINGEVCKVFQFGTDTTERFEAEAHYAVSPDGDIYTIDLLQGPAWILYVD